MLRTVPGAKVPYKVVDPRAGDTIAVWAATELAESLIPSVFSLDLYFTACVALQTPGAVHGCTFLIMSPERAFHPMLCCLFQCCVTAPGAKVPYKVVDRRAGDTIAVWAATELAESLLGWKSKLSLADMCRDQWAWASKYPQVRLVCLCVLIIRNSCRLKLV